MSYYLFDSRGYVSDGPSIQGWEDFVDWIASETDMDAVDQFIKDGSVEALDEFIGELGTVNAPGSVERTRRIVLAAARRAQDILILSNGFEHGDLRAAGGAGSGNFGHAGRPGQVGGSAPDVAAESFNADLSQFGFVNPMNEREFVINNEAAVELSRTSNGIRLHAIRSFAPKSGAGTRAMQVVMNVADKHGFTITGTAKPFDTGQKGTLKSAPLKQWYKKLGFEVDSRGDMVRRPLRTAGGAGSGNFGHAGRPGQVGGSSPDGREAMTPKELRQQAIVALVYNELAAPAYHSKQDFSRMSPEDRVKLLDVSGKLIDKEHMPVQIRTDRNNYDKNGVGAYAYSAFKRESEEKNWTPQQAFDEGLKRGLFVVAEGSINGYEPMSSIGASVSRFNILEGMNADERDRFEEAYIRTFADGKNRKEPIDSLEYLIKGGWTTNELERFADRVQMAGGSSSKPYDERSNIDSFARTLAFYSKDYDEFRAQMFSGWASASNTAVALTTRGVAAEAFPLKAGKFYEAHLEDSSYGWTFNGYDPRVSFSPRAVENMRRLKSETEAFYKKQLKTDDLTTKPLVAMRAIGGKIEAYTPASVESWTTDARTVDRFGKMMGKNIKRDGWGSDTIYTSLQTEVTFDDVLWSYKSAKGQRGWPEEKQLKGKKEFVLLGSRVKKVEAKHVYL